MINPHLLVFSYLNVDLSPVIDEIYQELNHAITQNLFYTSATSQCRSDITAQLKFKLSEMFKFKIDDAGFHKNVPGWRYSLHKDFVRKVSINTLLVDPSPEFQTVFRVAGTEMQVEFKRNVPVMLNVKELHKVNNYSNIDTRYILTLGSNDIDYYQLRDRYTNDYKFISDSE
jgi:hypothetical protein